MLVFGHEVRIPVDIVYGSPTEAPAQTYSVYVEDDRERMTEAYEEVQIALRKAAERNKRYYDVRVKKNTYSVGDWVYYINPRKFRGIRFVFLEFLLLFSRPFVYCVFGFISILQFVFSHSFNPRLRRRTKV